MEITFEEMRVKDLGSSDPKIRKEAVDRIGEKGDINLITPLLKDESADARYIAARCIGQRGDVNLLTPLLNDENADVRWIAAYWVKEKGQKKLSQISSTDIMKEGDEKMSNITVENKEVSYRYNNGKMYYHFSVLDRHFEDLISEMKGFSGVVLMDNVTVNEEVKR